MEDYYHHPDISITPPITTAWEIPMPPVWISVMVIAKVTQTDCTLFHPCQSRYSTRGRTVYIVTTTSATIPPHTCLCFWYYSIYCYRSLTSPPHQSSRILPRPHPMVSPSTLEQQPYLEQPQHQRHQQMVACGLYEWYHHHLSRWLLYALSWHLSLLSCHHLSLLHNWKDGNSNNMWENYTFNSL